MTGPNPSWYDLLGVEPGASEAEVRGAWRTAIADLDPTDRRFATYSRAAEVLLDAQRRAAYDAELAPAPPAEETTDTARPRESTESDPAVRRPVPAWLLAAMAVLTAAALAAAGLVWTTVPSDASVEQSTRDAEASAERAVGPILSYDYRHLDEDQQAAQGYLTSDYREEYDKLFEVVKDNATDTESVVQARPIASSIVRSGTDRVEVFLFVDQSTTNQKYKTPVVYKNQVRAQMQRVDGQWLVDCLITTPNGRCD